MDTILTWLRDYTRKKDFIGMTITIVVLLLFVYGFGSRALKGEIHDYDQLNIQPTLTAHQVQLTTHASQLADHEERLKAAEQMKADLAALKQMACDQSQHPPPSCYAH